MKALIVIAVLVSGSMSQAMAKCEFRLNEISPNPIIATGNTKDAALENAATKCFNMYEELTIRRTGHGLTDDDAGYTIANACTNVRCG